jgi:AcrR family transcriptional regulator
MPIAPRDNVPGEGSSGESLDTRARIAAAAFELFAAKGFDSTTVDAVAERAGIARRTFFRYFRSKDDVIFPDHDALLRAVTQQLATQTGSPVEALCSGVRLVLRSYVDDRQVSVQRYRLTRSVDALRDRELASVRRYERAFSRYIRERLAGTFEPADAALRADVVAAIVVAAHNAVLREWLRAGGEYDPANDLDGALTWVTRTFGPTLGGPAGPDAGRDAGRNGGQEGGQDGAGPAARTSSGPTAGGEPNDDVVVAVFRADQPIGDVVERISRSL